MLSWHAGCVNAKGDYLLKNLARITALSACLAGCGAMGTLAAHGPELASMVDTISNLKGKIDEAERQIAVAQGIAAAAKRTTDDLESGKVSLVEGLAGLAATAVGIWVARNRTRPRAVQREIEHVFEEPAPKA